MEFWIILWKVVLIGGIGLFALMAIWVTIGGFRDIKKLLKILRQTHEEP